MDLPPTPASLSSSSSSSSSAALQQHQKFEDKKRKQSQSLEPISLEKFKRNVEQDLNIKQQDFHKRLDEADHIRKYGPALEDKAELPYIPRKMPAKQVPPREITPTPTPKRTEEDYLRSHVAMLEQSIRSLKREIGVWISKYKQEARNRGILMDLKDNMDEALMRQHIAEKQAVQYGEQIDIDRQLIRKLRLQIIDLKKSVHKREMVAVHSEELNDLLYKPKLETLNEEHETLEDEHYALKEHFESMYRELSKFQSGARLKERKKRMAKALEEASKKKKKGGGRKSNKKNKKKKKRGKNEPLKVWEQIDNTLKNHINHRKQKIHTQINTFIQNKNQQKTMEAANNSNQEIDVVPKEYIMISPLQSSFVVLPLQNYIISSNLSKTLLTEIPEIAINNLYSILSQATLAYLNNLKEKDTINRNISFGETLIDILIDIYEVWPVIQMYIYGVIETIKHFTSEENYNVRVAFFGRLLGIVNPELYSERAASTFLPILSSLTKGKIEFALTGNLIYQHDEKISPDACFFITMEDANKICRRTFKNFEVKYENFSLALTPAIYEQLENNLIQFSIMEMDPLEVKRNGGSDRKIDLDTFLATTMNAWYEQAHNDLHGLATTVWQQFGCTENQVFDLPLLKDMLEANLPKPYTPDELKLIYKQLMSCQNANNNVGKGLNVSDGTVDRETFAIVLHSYGITPFKSELSEEELIEIAKKKKKKQKKQKREK